MIGARLFTVFAKPFTHLTVVNLDKNRLGDEGAGALQPLVRPGTAASTGLYQPHRALCSMEKCRNVYVKLHRNNRQ